MSNKGKILFFDDDKDFTSQFAGLMEDSGFEIMTFNGIDEIRSAIRNQQLMFETKALIFDLANNPSEHSGTKGFAILSDIYANFNKYRIPIFIHSAFSEQIRDFDDLGTVWKIEKSGESLSNIVGIIEKLDESGFIEAFSPNGIIEQSLMLELHKSFTEQFRKGEIEKILIATKKSNPDNFRERSITILKRIAVRSLMSELLSPVVSDGDTVNPIEHYYRRISKLDFWTGDIFTKNDKSETVLILTPRCDVINAKNNCLLVCIIEPANYSLPSKKEEKLKQIRNYLTDNIQGKAIRYLPQSPLFLGGKVNLSTNKSIEKGVLMAEYDRVVTLSDDLTNEILGKFAYYFMRTGINTISAEEFDSYLELLKE